MARHATLIGTLIIVVLIVEPHRTAALWRTAKDRLREDAAVVHLPADAEWPGEPGESVFAVKQLEASAST